MLREKISLPTSCFNVRIAHARGMSVTLFLDLETAMNQHYRQIKGLSLTRKVIKEMQLSACGGTYYHHEQAGHTAHDRPKKANNNSGTGKVNQQGGQGKFQKKCDNCGRPGHKAMNCWGKAKNQGKKPQLFKGKLGGGKKVEFLLCRGTQFSFLQIK